MKARAILNSFVVNSVEDGLDAPRIELSRSTILYDATNSGAATTAQTFQVTYSLKVNENSCVVAARDVAITTPVNMSYSNKTNTSCGFSIAQGASVSGVITISITGTLNGDTYTAKATISVEANKKGDTGERGKTGRFFYYAGVFDRNDNTNTFIVSDAQAPFFMHTESGQARFHVFNPSTNPQSGSMTMSQMWADSGSNWNNSPWVAMTNDFEYLITKAIFGEFAKFGSAIISGDWMISQHGTINGIASTNYEAFNPDHPNDNIGTNFIPNYCVDLLTGATYQQEAYISGEVHAQSLSTEFIDVSFANNDTYYVNLDENYEEKGEKYWNYRFVPQNANDRLSIVLPVNKYSHFGQRVILYNPTLTKVGNRFVAQSYITVESLIIDEYGMTTRRPILGISATGAGTWDGSQTTPINAFTPVEKIYFANGILELVCVPPYDSDPDAICDWAMVNIGTNYYGVESYYTL